MSEPIRVIGWDTCPSDIISGQILNFIDLSDVQNTLSVFMEEARSSVFFGNFYRDMARLSSALESQMPVDINERVSLFAGWCSVVGFEVNGEAAALVCSYQGIRPLEVAGSWSFFYTFNTVVDDEELELIAPVSEKTLLVSIEENDDQVIDFNG